MMQDDQKITIFTNTTPPKKSLKPSSQKKKSVKELKKGSDCCVFGCEQQCDPSKTKCSSHLHAAKLYQKKYRTKKAQATAQEIGELKAQLESVQAELESAKRREVQYQERLKAAKR